MNFKPKTSKFPFLTTRSSFLKAALSLSATSRQELRLQNREQSLKSWMPRVWTNLTSSKRVLPESCFQKTKPGFSSWRTRWSLKKTSLAWSLSTKNACSSAFVRNWSRSETSRRSRAEEPPKRIHTWVMLRSSNLWRSERLGPAMFWWIASLARITSSLEESNLINWCDFQI